MAEFKLMRQFTQYVRRENSQLEKIFTKDFDEHDKKLISKEKEELLQGFVVERNVSYMKAVEVCDSCVYHEYVETVTGKFIHEKDKLYVTDKGVDFLYKRWGVEWGMWAEVTRHFNSLFTIILVIITSLILGNIEYVINVFEFILELILWVRNFLNN